jgi:cytochrome c553
LGVKDLTVRAIPEAEIGRQIREGKKGPQGKALMPSFKESLSDEEIKALVEHVLKLRK